ncbi:MAG: EamA family transporter [Actinomycetaceae bacterium]|nr:EamA family transporter [Actinomycetaceae bacterium]
MPQRHSLPQFPPQIFIIGSALTQYIGAAIAVMLFTRIDAPHVAWWRLVIAGIVLLAWRRPWRDGLTKRDLAISALFGLILATMNVSFYSAISYIPMGTVVSVEFIGPVTVAVLRGRGWIPRIAALLALLGVSSIGGLGLNLTRTDDQLGVAWTLLAALAWGSYIVLGQKIAQNRSGITNLALGCASGAVIYAPILGPGALAALSHSDVMVALLGVALLSTVVPYSLEALAMRKLSAATFALFTALLPASSALVGAIMLAQIPGIWEIIGLVLVSIAVWLATRYGNKE